MTISSRIFRLSRAQFLPVILSPVVVGTVLAWWSDRMFSPLLFVLVSMGSICLHLAANTIDDAYDYKSGVDGNSFQRKFPNQSGLSNLFLSSRIPSRVSRRRTQLTRLIRPNIRTAFQLSAYQDEDGCYDTQEKRRIGKFWHELGRCEDFV